MSEKSIIYWMPASPPCRTVYAVSKLVNADVEWKILDLTKKDQLAPEFLKMNPFHQVPTMVEPDGFTMFESRAIARYLIQSRKPDSDLYPMNDLKQRALIDRWLDLDLGLLYRSISDVVYGIFRSGIPVMEKLPRLLEVLEMMEKYLEQTKYDYLAGGQDKSLADITTYFTLSLLEPIKNDVDLTKFPLIQNWQKRMSEFIKELDGEDRTMATGQENLVAYSQMMMQQAKEQQPQ